MGTTAEPSTSGLRRFVAAHSLIVFVVLAYACSWWTVPLLGGPLGGGVTIAAVIVLAITQGRPGVLVLWRRITQWRVGWHWFALAVLLPAVTSFVAIAGTVALGADLVLADALAKAPEIPVNLVALLLLPLFGPWEEPGFRGFALSKALERWSPLGASALVGVIHVGWHLPLFMIGDIPPSDVVLILAAAIVFTSLVLGSGGSVLVAMVMHASNNAFSGEFASTLFAGADGTVYGWIQALQWVAIAAALAMRPAFRSRRAGGAEPGALQGAPS